MRNEFTAVIEREARDGTLPTLLKCLEPMAKGRPRKRHVETWPKQFALILEDRRQDEP